MSKPYKRASDGLWAQQIELPPRPDGKRRRKTVYAKSRPDVIRKARAAQAERDKMGDMLTTSPTVARWLERWLDEIIVHEVRPKTFQNYQHMVTLINPPIGRVKIDTLAPSHIRRLKSFIMDERGLSRTTARNAHAVLRKALNDAMAEGVVSRNIAEIVSAPEVAHYEAKILTAEQGIELLRRVAHDPRATIRWSLALMMGMRQGECLGLRADHVDIEAGTIKVEWQLQRLEMPPRSGEKFEDLGDSYYLTRPKTERGDRNLAMPPQLHEMMRRWIPALPGPESFVCGPGIVDERTDARAWRRALREADLPPVRLHSARHTTLTLLAKLGVAEHIRMKIAGHASKEVLKGYTHGDDQDMRDAMNKVGAAFQPKAIEG